MTDLRVLAALLRGMPQSGPLAERLDAFYAPQAARYDAFRRQLLRGRDDLVAELRPRAGSRLLELGAGTGQTLDYLGDAARDLESIELVDVCPSLLAKARERSQGLGNVRVVEADATTYRPASPPDIVLFSYSLSMMPEWQRALANARAMLAPGGRIGIVDFFVDSDRHGRVASAFWRRWFGHDGVRVDNATLTGARAQLKEQFLIEGRTPLPYLPILRVPYFVFVGSRVGVIPDSNGQASGDSGMALS